MTNPTSGLTKDEERGLVSHVNLDNPEGPLIKHRGNPLSPPAPEPKKRPAKNRKKKS